MHLTILKASFDACSFYEITRRSSSVELKFVVEFFDNSYNLQEHCYNLLNSSLNSFPNIPTYINFIKITKALRIMHSKSLLETKRGLNKEEMNKLA